MAGNASAAFPASLLSASASLSNHFYRVSFCFDARPPAPPPPPKTPAMVRTIVEIVTERAVSIENMAIPCSLIRYDIFPLGMYLYQELFQGFA